MEFEEDEGAEFIFFLAEKLGKTVGEIEDMPGEEFLKWNVYFGRQAQRKQVAAKQAGGGKS